MSSKYPVDEKSLDDNAVEAFCETFLVSETNMSLIIYNWKKYLCSVFVCFCNIWRLNEENKWYDISNNCEQWQEKCKLMASFVKYL